MTKEEVLKKMKDSIMELYARRVDLKKEEAFKEWHNRWKPIEKEVKSLSSCDLQWVDEQYGKWFKGVFKREIDEAHKKMKQD